MPRSPCSPCAPERGFGDGGRKVDVRLPGNGNSDSHGARPVHLIITMMKWIRTSRLSIKNSLSVGCPDRRVLRVPLREGLGMIQFSI